jgi:galactose mutarotase-like enzyme
MEKIPYLGTTIHRWRAGNSTFLALPERGARLMNWNLALGDGSIRDILYWPELGSLDGFPSVRGGNPVLFPFAGRSFDQGEADHWRAADGVRRPMPRHGLARQGTFSLSRLDGRGFAARFEPGEEARAAYPFDYEFTVTYRFEPLAFSCEYTLQNLGDTPLPWSPGHHFYFTVPWSEGSARADYLIRIPAGQHLRQDSAGQLVPAPGPAANATLADPALLDLIHTGLRGNEAVFGEKGRPGDISIQLGTAKKPPGDSTFVTWSESPESPFYCVEPWMGPPGAATHGRGLQLVPPGQTRNFVVTLAVR